MNHDPSRRYTRLGALLADLGYLARSLPGQWRLFRGGLDPKFRERIMLAVTQVNECSFCSFAHTRMALAAGVERDEVRALLAGEFEGVPDQEHAALLYAQHWAESGRKPDPEATEAFDGAYDADTRAMIELTMRFICTWNYFFKTLEYILFRISFGRLCAGKTPSPQEEA